MSLVSGLRSGVRSVLRSGLNPSDAVDPLAGVTRDPGSLIYCPANATEWSIVMSVAGITSGGPSLLWSLQEASGNAADSIGTFTGAVSGAPLTYRQAVSGWTRLGLLGGDGGTGLVANLDAGLPDSSTTSCLSLGYVILTSVPVSAASISMIGLGTITNDVFTNAAKLRISSGANTTTGTPNTSGAVRPYGVVHDVTNNRAAGWSDQEILAVTRGATTSKGFRLLCGFPGVHLYRVGFFGAAAELTNGQIRTLLQTLGWTVAW